MSVPSVLNMKYVQEVGNTRDSDGLGPEWAKKAMSDFAVGNLLQSAGYKFYSVNTGVYFTQVETSNVLYSPFVNLKFDFRNFFRLSVVDRNVYSSTMLMLFEEELSRQDFEVHRTHIRKGLEALRYSIRLPGPKFIFTHLLSPHHPYVFDKNGRSVTPEKIYESEGDAISPGNLRGYSNQVAFISSQIKAIMIDLVKQDPDAVIVIMGDHGGRHRISRDVNKADMMDCFPNLIAIRDVNLTQQELESIVTPVNIFRVIFNRNFYTAYPILENRQYFHWGQDKHRLIDVTDRVRASSHE